jgi:hypothetical protein
LQEEPFNNYDLLLLIIYELNIRDE